MFSAFWSTPEIFYYQNYIQSVNSWTNHSNLDYAESCSKHVEERDLESTEREGSLTKQVADVVCVNIVQWTLTKQNLFLNQSDLNLANSMYVYELDTRWYRVGWPEKGTKGLVQQFSFGAVHAGQLKIRIYSKTQFRNTLNHGTQFCLVSFNDSFRKFPSWCRLLFLKEMFSPFLIF